MVVDNLLGMRRLAHEHGWVLQLCHFHLLLKLYVHRRGVRYALRGGPAREEIYQLIRDPWPCPTAPACSLRRLSHSDCGTIRIQMAVREFLHDLQFYRSHLAHPRLGLPRTTNTVESMGRLLREMFRSNRSGTARDATGVALRGWPA